MRGYTQQSLARAAGVSQSAVASYESGRCHSSRAIRRLARALQVLPDWLETGQGPRDARALDMLQEPPAMLAPPRRAALSTRDQAILERVLQTYLQACSEWPADVPGPARKPNDT